MSYQAPSPVKSRLARERYRKVRRHQLAAVVAVGSLLAAVAIILIPLLLLVRSCGNAGPGGGRFARDPADPRWAREIAALDLAPAPWFCELGVDRLYAATDSRRRETTYPAFPLDSLVAYDLEEGKELWRSVIDAEFSDFYLGGGKLAGFRQYLVEPPHVLLAAYDAQDGSPAWSVDIPDATEGCIAPHEEVVVLGYRLPDGYRLAAYNLEVQAKSWGMQLPMRGLLSQQLLADVTAELSVRCWPGIAVYQLANVVGLVAVGRGERLREYAAPSFIDDVALDIDSSTCYVLLHGSEPGSFLLQAMPFRGGSVRNVASFETTDDHPRLLASGGAVVLCYRTDGSGAKAQTMVLGIHAAAEEPVLEQELAGVVADIVALPSDQHSLLLALNEGIGEDGYPKGWGTLQRIDFREGHLEQVARFRRPVLYLGPFKEECLVLLLGGDVHTFIPLANACLRVKRARYPVLDWLANDQRSGLAVLSYTRQYLQGRPGQPFQAIVYE